MCSVRYCQYDIFQLNSLFPFPHCHYLYIECLCCTQRCQSISGHVYYASPPSPLPPPSLPCPATLSLFLAPTHTHASHSPTYSHLRLWGRSWRQSVRGITTKTARILQTKVYRGFEVRVTSNYKFCVLVLIKLVTLALSLCLPWIRLARLSFLGI